MGQLDRDKNCDGVTDSFVELDLTISKVTEHLLHFCFLRVLEDSLFP